jgi:lysophospholipase L1-like esterase
MGAYSIAPLVCPSAAPDRGQRERSMTEVRRGQQRKRRVSSRRSNFAGAVQMRRVLCFGDSNTWGAAAVPRPDGRYGEEERWPGVLSALLGKEWRVVEEGLSGRTTVHCDPIEGAWLNGSRYVLPCLRSHRPLDAVVIMLGTNDLKSRFNVSAREIAASVATLVAIARSAEAGPSLAAPQLLLVCPPPLLDHHGECPHFADLFRGGHAKSLELPERFAEMARENEVELLDAGSVIRSSAFDGVHLDPEDHRLLGRAVAERLGTLFPSAR